MKHLKLFESFEIVYPIKYGEPLNNKEINLLKGYNVMCPEFIQKDDNYYYVHDHRCENIKDLPLTYIHGVCSKFNIRNYVINDDYTIDVEGDVNFCERGLTKIPLRFNMVTGSFYCSNNKLTTLEGCPESVGDTFTCKNNKLDTLEGGPKQVGGSFNCNFNNLTTLIGSPKRVNDTFCCQNNKLDTLEGSPEYVGGYFFCRKNPLTSVEYKGTIKGKIYQ